MRVIRQRVKWLYKDKVTVLRPIGKVNGRDVVLVRNESGIEFKVAVVELWDRPSDGCR